MGWISSVAYSSKDFDIPGAEALTVPSIIMESALGSESGMVTLSLRISTS